MCEEEIKTKQQQKELKMKKTTTIFLVCFLALAGCVTPQMTPIEKESLVSARHITYNLY